MLSEWMIDVPENLETHWVAVACPEGRRCLVIAAKVEINFLYTDLCFLNLCFRVILLPTVRPGEKCFVSLLLFLVVTANSTKVHFDVLWPNS